MSAWAGGREDSGLASLGPSSAICVLALDHRDAMRNAFARAGVAELSEAAILDVKARIADVLADRASALLLDPPALPRCSRPGLSVFVPLEAQGHEPLSGGRVTRLLEDFGPSDAAALGVQGCKLLLYYRADHPVTAARQRQLLGATAAACHRFDLPLVVEPLVYRLSGEDEEDYADAFGDLVVAAAEHLADSGADMLKLQFPGSTAACERVSLAATPLPWSLLGGGDIDGLTLAEQLEVACRAGASGFIAGRAIWGGALRLKAEAQTAWLREHAQPLFDGLVEIADTHARSRAS